jgi:hypothetical protein
MMYSTYAYPLDQLEQVMTWAHEMQPKWSATMEPGFYGMYPRQPDGLPIEGAEPVLAIIAYSLCDSEEQAREELQLLETCPVREQALFAQEYVPASLNELYDLIDTVVRPETAYSGDNMWTDADADELVPAFSEMVRDMPTEWSYVLWWPWVEQPFPDSALSVAGKHYISPFAGWEDPADEARLDPWGRDHIRRADHLSKGIQLADENLLGRPESRYMSDENAERLEELRAKWDPEGRFHTFLFGDANG